MAKAPSEENSFPAGKAVSRFSGKQDYFISISPVVQVF
jgi:hypothetical protein